MTRYETGWPQVNPELLKALTAERDEWRSRAEMIWRQRDAADRRARQAEEKLAEIEALCTRPVDGESRSHVPVAGVLAILRGEGDRPAASYDAVMGANEPGEEDDRAG